MEHHLGGGLSVIGFGPDRIRTVVSMATDSSHRVIMEKIVRIRQSQVFSRTGPYMVRPLNKRS